MNPITRSVQIQKLRSAFHESWLVGEQLFAEGKISWEEYSRLMVGFESKLRDMGDDF